MAEQVGSAVVGEVVSTAASFLTNKFEELNGISDKVERLEWKLLKIQSAIEESNKYDIENEALQKMHQELMDAAQEVNEVLEEFRNSSSAADPQHSGEAVELQNPITAPDPQSLDHVVAVQNPIIAPDLEMLDRGGAMQDTIPNESVHVYRAPRNSITEWTKRTFRLGVLLCTADSIICDLVRVMIRPIRTRWGQSVLGRMREIQKLNRVLERVERISGDISDFLEMLRHQKRKRERRRRYRPYKSFFQLAYLELAQDALGYWWGQVSWMQFLVSEIDNFAETKTEFGLKAGVRICCLML